MNFIARSAVLLSIAMAASAHAEKVEVVLKDKLDGNLSGYCLDIKGGNRNVDVSNGLQAHTCYSYRGTLGSDQTFETTRFAENMLYMPEYNVCAEVSGFSTGQTVGLASCNGTAAQQFLFSGEGLIRPVKAPNMCFTAGANTTFGRGGTSPHQIKTLTLQPCSEELAEFQSWRVRAKED